VKKFAFPFDSYELSSERPMSIELHPQGVARYKHLVDNPIYYFYSFQYVNGDLYRAIFGYEVMWDKEYEDKLVLSLDYLLYRHSERREYYIEEIQFISWVKLRGFIWRDGVKPKLTRGISFQARPIVKRGTRATARVNLLDKPNHVDIHFYDDQIISVSLMDYLNWKRTSIRSLTDENYRQTQPKPTDSKTEARESKETPSFKKFSSEVPHRQLPTNVLDMRERFRRSTAMPQTHKKVSKRLVPQ
jgi:hypothetical protein